MTIGDRPFNMIDYRLILYFIGVLMIIGVISNTYVMVQIIKLQSDHNILSHNQDENIKAIKNTMDTKIVNSTVELSNEHKTLLKELLKAEKQEHENFTSHN